MNNKLGNDPLATFLKNYDYSFWYHKIFSLDEIYKDENFINKVSSKMKGGDVEKIRRSLAFEIFMTSQQLIETLFMLIGAFTYSPKDPYPWMNKRDNFGYKISNLIKDDSYEIFLKTLGLETVDDYVRYLFYDIPTKPEFKEKLDGQIEPTKACLKLLAIEHSINEDLYNAYKHGFIAHRGDIKIIYHSPSRQMRLQSQEIPVVFALPKRLRMAAEVEVKDERVAFDIDNVYFKKLKYERQREISKRALVLIRDIIESRRVVLRRGDSIQIELLPPVDEIEKIFQHDEK
ncbi:MAG: hypothetical protein CEE41_01720 [Hadesarchaea archaeon B3_Hades]|nr:MAG: hypothetical protein CEE41_01720 [Hadesarchaea archaeon B3_Hades]